MSRRRSRTRSAAITALVAVIVLLPDAGAQATVAGTVYDSLGRRPLAGAMVQIVSAGESTQPRTHTATSDSLGRFSVAGVLPGSYIAGFFHFALDSIGVELAPRRLDVPSAVRSVRLDLAIPGARSMARAFCGSAALGDSVSAVFGRLYDADSGRPVENGRVTMFWVELSIGQGGVTRSRPVVNGRTGADGAFVFCGAPGGGLVGLLGIRGADTSGTVEIELPGGSSVRRDLYVARVTTSMSADTIVLGDGTRTTVVSVQRRGSASLTGSVKTSDGRPLPSARIQVAESGLDAISDANGRFLLTNAPGGSQRVEIRAIGYYPETRSVDLVAGRRATVDVTLSTLRSVLDTVKVFASRVYSTDRSGFERRRRASAAGRFFDQNDVLRLRPTDITRLLDRVPGVTRGWGMDAPILMRSASGGGYCQPAVYIDGMRLTELTASDIAMWVRPEELAGMEVYSRGGHVPAEYTRLDGCGTIVLWTQRPIGRRR